MNLIRLFSLLTISLTLFACGRKAPPLPIEKSIPQNPNLEIEATPLGLNLWITLPDKTLGGLPLNKIRALIIEREEVPVEAPGPSKKITFKLKPKLHSAGRIFLYTDTDLKEGTCYVYRLRVEKDLFVSTPFTEGQRACWTMPPKPPGRISLQRDREGTLILKWSPPDSDLKGKPLKGKIYYKILKYNGDNIIPYEVASPPFIDSGEGQRLCYRIQALLIYHGTPIPSPLSELFCVD